MRKMGKEAIPWDSGGSVPGRSSIRACWGSRKSRNRKRKDENGRETEGREDFEWKWEETGMERVDGWILHGLGSKSVNGEASLRQGALGSDARTPFTSGAAYLGQGDDGWLLGDGGE